MTGVYVSLQTDSEQSERAEVVPSSLSEGVLEPEPETGSPSSTPNPILLGFESLICYKTRLETLEKASSLVCLHPGPHSAARGLS